MINFLMNIQLIDIQRQRVVLIKVNKYCKQQLNIPEFLFQKQNEKGSFLLCKNMQ